MEDLQYFVTTHYRCLKFRKHESESLFLTLCGLEDCRPGKSFGPVRRSGYHLHVILSGKGTLEVNGRRIPLHAGQLFIEKPNETTSYYADSEHPWTYCWVTFDGTKAEEYCNAAGFTEGVNTLNCYTNTDEYLKLMNEILTRPKLTLADDLMRLGTLYQFLSLAIHSYNRSVSGHRHTGYSPDSYVDHALDYIRGNYANMKIADIPDFIGINRSYFTNIFHERMGISPKEYLMRFRLSKAARLLSATELSVQDISSSVGYENPLTFSKAFKNQFGVSPKYYRQMPFEERLAIPLPELPEYH